MTTDKFTDKELDSLLSQWAGKSLPPDLDGDVTSSLVFFLEDDDTEQALVAHIHTLAMDENGRKRMRRRITLSSAAAILILIISGISLHFILSDDLAGTHHESKGITASLSPLEAPENDSPELVAALMEEESPQTPVAGIPEETKTAQRKTKAPPVAKPTATVVDASREDYSYEMPASPDMDGEELVAVLAEVNLSIGSMIDGAVEEMENLRPSISQINYDLLSDNLSTEGNHPGESPSMQSSDYPVGRLNVFLINLTETLSEIKGSGVSIAF